MMNTAGGMQQGELCRPHTSVWLLLHEARELTAAAAASYTAGNWPGEQKPRCTSQIGTAYITFWSSPQAQTLRKCLTSPTKVDPAPIEASRLLAPQYRLSQSKLYSPMAAAHRGLR